MMYPDPLGSRRVCSAPKTCRIHDHCTGVFQGNNEGRPKQVQYCWKTACVPLARAQRTVSQESQDGEPQRIFRVLVHSGNGGRIPDSGHMSWAYYESLSCQFGVTRHTDSQWLVCDLRTRAVRLQLPGCNKKDPN